MSMAEPRELRKHCPTSGIMTKASHAALPCWIVIAPAPKDL